MGQGSESLNDMAEEGGETCHEDAMSRYKTVKAAKIGSLVTCPSCGRPFRKKSYHHTFCNNKGRENCKDRFWNRATPERQKRAKEWNR